MIETISIAGVPVELIPINREELKGLSLDLLLSFRFYKTKFNQYDLCVAELTNSARSYTPRQYSRTAALVERILKMPIVFRLSSAPSYMRIRLIEQGVYFIISDRYVFLPGLLINERMLRTGKPQQKLSPVGQYILLYYLLHKEIEKFTMIEMQSRLPYNYLAVSRAISELEDKQLFHVEKEWKTKWISSLVTRKELWENAMMYLSSPIKKIIYTDELWKGSFYTGGITALSHYSFLNPDDQQTLVTWEKDFDPDGNSYSEWEALDFKYRIEVWKYSPEMGSWQDGYVDKLSLYLSMQDENDPRVEKELETIINEIWQ